jgi:hypothetical protein
VDRLRTGETRQLLRRDGGFEKGASQQKEAGIQELEGLKG